MNLPAKRSAGVHWIVQVLAFPVALVVACVWLAAFAFRQRPRPPSKPNTTPCGKLCKHAFWMQERKDWLCGAGQGRPCDHVRKHLKIPGDPNNCSMFERKP